MAVTTSNPGPYAPASAILEIIDRFRNRGLTKPFTPEVLGRAGVSGSLVPRTMQSLVALELVDDAGNPTETMENLRRCPEPEFKGLLAAWINAVYADVLSFVNADDDEAAIRDAFRPFNPVGQQQRMVSLFLGLCRAASLRSDEQSTPVARPRARKAPAAKQKASPRRASEIEAGKPTFPVAPDIPAPLAGLLVKLPQEGGKWTDSDRAKWLATFTAVLDYCFSIGDPDENEVSDE